MTSHSCTCFWVRRVAVTNTTNWNQRSSVTSLTSEIHLRRVPFQPVEAAVVGLYNTLFKESLLLVTPALSRSGWGVGVGGQRIVSTLARSSLLKARTPDFRVAVWHLTPKVFANFQNGEQTSRGAGGRGSCARSHVTRDPNARIATGAGGASVIKSHTQYLLVWLTLGSPAKHGARAAEYCFTIGAPDHGGALCQPRPAVWTTASAGGKRNGWDSEEEGKDGGGERGEGSVPGTQTARARIIT